MHDLIFYYPKDHEAHFEYGHPERPDRLLAIKQALESENLWNSYPHLEPIQVTEDILSTVHDQNFLARLRAASSEGQRMDLDTYTTKKSWDIALNTVGGGLSVTSAVWKRDANKGFALTRPPGHHATKNRAMGFCLLNNIAIAAEFIIRYEGAAKVAIIDLDLHHGNGTQDIFWKRGDVMYISTHQYPHYPGTGSLNEIGEGSGEGSTVNFPLPPFSGDQAFKEVMESGIIPLLNRYYPQMILVSYGFDTHWRDPLGNILLSAEAYSDLISTLSAWADENCGGRTAIFLEGGYDLEAAAVCTHGVVAALINIAWEDSLGKSPQSETDNWKDMLSRAKKIWGL